MAFEKSNTGGEQRPVGQPEPNPIWRQSGQRQEPFRTPFVGERRGEGCKRQRLSVIMRFAAHGVVCRNSIGGNGLAKILVVEDNALNIKLFCDLLAAHGHQPEGVLDSRNALDAARAFKPDLVITDIQLPHVTGLELMELIRKDEELHDVPIMAVTAYAGVGDDERIRAAGAQAYVSKPISVVRFAETVEDLLAGKAQQPEPATP